MAGVRAKRVYPASTGDSRINKPITSNEKQLWRWSLTAFNHDELTQAIPELNDLRQVVEHSDWHTNDVLQQSLSLFEWVKGLPGSLLTEIETPKAVLQALLTSVVDTENDDYTTHELLAFAALIHDVGKTVTFQRLSDSSTRCPGHETVSARMAPNICARFDFTPLETHFITSLVRMHGEPYELFKEIATLPVTQQHERIGSFRADHADHLRSLLLLAFGDLLTSHLQANHPQKYIAILHFYQRWFCSAFGVEQEDNESKDDR